MTRFTGLLLSTCFVAAACPAGALAASVAAAPAKDNTLYAEFDTLSNGAGQRVFAGRNGLGDNRRALVQFDLAGLVPAGATVDSVVLRLTVVQTGAGSRTVSLHRLLADWGEGTSLAGAGEGAGAPAEIGDATWGQRFFGLGQPWATPGGDIAPAASASRPVGSVGAYTWRSAGMIADVASWLQNAATNFGWEIVGDEAVTGSAKAFGSRQAATTGNRPVLTIYYTEAPTGVMAGPVRAQLFPVHPNPFNPTTTIRYTLTASARVNLTVYDAAGRRIRVLFEGIATAGAHELVWNGEDARGRRAASGIYMVRLVAPGAPVQVEKMVLLK